ncbi:helix-turn-helix transcriptional regulator [Streptomyces lunalinharesii]|uniref:Helix-turn-helix transcriptional regulator n=1 Tax=Streptomyces lunalinharesii TaxID=333384 RepID=A0ABN3SKE7_9ACTN
MPADPTAQVSPLAQGTPSSHDEDDDNPFVAGKVLGAHLRHLRRSKGLGLKDVAPQIRASVSKISRMERGESPPREKDVLDLVCYYGVTDPDQLGEILELLRQSKTQTWLHQYSDITPGWLRRLIGLEDSATEIRAYEVNLVPGLLQTSGYTRAIIKAARPHDTEEEIQRRLELRAIRQRIVERATPPRLTFLLDQSILLRPIGGPEVIRQQLQHLRRLADEGRVSIQIVTFDKGASLGPGAPVTHMSFPAHGPSELIYLEHINSALYLSKRADVESYRHVLDELMYVAESRKSSRALLDEAIERFSDQSRPK